MKLMDAKWSLSLLDQAPESMDELLLWMDTLTTKQFEMVWVALCADRLLDASIPHMLMLLHYVRERYRGKHHEAPHKLFRKRPAYDLDEAHLTTLYLDELLSVREIAARVGCSTYTVADELRRLGIMRSKAESCAVKHTRANRK